MQEIAPHIYIENGYPGVTLGAINYQHGLVLLDAPFRPEDARSWRAGLLNLGGGVDRLLINLDAHYDRTLGARAMECTLVGHERIVQAFRTRPVTFKTQSPETGAAWELHSPALSSVRWLPPEITFSHQMYIHWDDNPILLESHPGPSPSAIWTVLPDQGIVFVGDCVVLNQPPFLANASLEEWIAALELLGSPQYKNYLVVSGRGGLAVSEQIKDQLSFLKKVQSQINELAEAKAASEETEKLVGGLLKPFKGDSELEGLYRQRLRWGLYQYYARRFRPASASAEE